MPEVRLHANQVIERIETSPVVELRQIQRHIAIFPSQIDGAPLLPRGVYAPWLNRWYILLYSSSVPLNYIDIRRQRSINPTESLHAPQNESQTVPIGFLLEKKEGTAFSKTQMSQNTARTLCLSLRLSS